MVGCTSRFKQLLNNGLVLLTLTSSLAVYSAPSKLINIRILGMNDFHGQVTAGKNLNNHPVGGAAVLASYIKAEQKGMENNTVITMSGDQTGAAPPASGLLKDEPSILFLNTLGNHYCSTQDRMAPQCNVVATVGNHEFDKGFQGMTEMLNGRSTGPTNGWTSLPTYPGTNFPMISANIVDAATGNPLFTPYVIKKIDGVTVGFIGAVLKDAPTIIVSHNITGIKFLEEAQAINHYIPEMKAKGAEVIVVLLHQGGNQKPYEGNTQASSTVEGPINEIVKQFDDAVDVVMAAHTHQFINAYLPNRTGKKVLVTQAHSYSAAFAEVNITFDREAHHITNKSARIITAYSDKGPGLSPDPAVAQLIKQAEDNVRPVVEAHIGTSQTALSKKTSNAGESNLGDLIADSFRNKMHSDMAFINPGSMRTDIPAGDINWGQLYAMSPFENSVIKISLSGSDVAALLEQQWQSDRTYILQISGINYTYNAHNASGHHVTSITVNNQPLQNDRLYTIATNDLLYNGGDNFTVMMKGHVIETNGTDIEALTQYIKSLPQPFNEKIDGRIKLSQ